MVILSRDNETLAQVRSATVTDSVLVRSDPLDQDSPSIRGGDIWLVSQIEECAAKYMPHRRALLLFEPYERSQNRWSFSVLVDKTRADWWLEIVGSGFDSGHLNRGRVAPHETYQGHIGNQSNLVIVSHQAFDADRYRDDREMLPPNAALGFEPLPEYHLSEMLSAASKLLRSRDTPPIFVLSGAILMPGQRLTYWDVFEPLQAGR